MVTKAELPLDLRITLKDPISGVTLRTFGLATLIFDDDSAGKAAELQIEIPLGPTFKEELKRGELAVQLTNNAVITDMEDNSL